MKHVSSRLAGTTLVLAMLAGCATQPSAPATPLAWHDARQMIVVRTADWSADHGTLQTFAREGTKWRATGVAFDVTVGRAGLGWGSGMQSSSSSGPQKAEGDGRAPAGVFALGTAFGYADSANTALPYKAMTASDYCIDEPTSPLYNRIVDANVVGARAVAASTEPMRRDIHLDGDQRYREGFVIQHNAGRVAGSGSCIFAHLWREPGTPTAGCTAMAAPDMTTLLAWLDPAAKPVFVALPAAEYARLQAAWDLPTLPAR